jgi:hypothetical protein
MIKYSATICALLDECLQLFEVMDICGLSISRMYVDNRIARIYAGTNEIMKIVIAADYFKGLLKNERNSRKLRVVSVCKYNGATWMPCNTLTMWYIFDGEKQPGLIILERLIFSSEGEKMKTGIILGFQSVKYIVDHPDTIHIAKRKKSGTRIAEIFYYSEKARN